MWSVDSLQNYLIREVAFAGEKGISFSDLGPIIANFNSPQSSARKRECSTTFTGLLPNLSNRKLSKYFRSNANFTCTNPDSSFCERVWSWLQSHPDTLVRTYQSSETLDLSNARQNADEGACSAEPSPSRRHRNNGPKEIWVDDKSLTKQNHRICGTESRIWQAVAGHGIDHQRIHALEFRLLSIIGKRKQQGIVQPDLIRISGQDKRSVPKRTDKLQDHGYIIKRPVIWNGMRTSHCTLKEFAKLPDANATIGSGFDSVDCLDITKFLLELFAILQKVKIIPLSELRVAMGSSGHRRETKFLALAIRRLEILGCLKRVLAKVTDKPTEVIKWMQCVKYIKVPSDDERRVLTTMTHDQEAFIRASQQQDDQDFASVTEPYCLAGSANEMNDESSFLGQPMTNSSPCWTPYLSYYDLIYGNVEESGAKGISSMKLRDNIFGHFCKKPFDVIISRLTDDDRTSQPISLRHLTLIKDTSFLDRVSHYTYRTFFNFKLAIESGEAAKEVLQTINKSPPPDIMALPLTAHGDQSGFLDTYSDTLLNLHRNASVSKVIKLSELKVNDKRSKRGFSSTLNSQKSPNLSKGFNFTTKAASVKEKIPKKRGRPRKHPLEEESSQRKSSAFSNDNSNSMNNELDHPSIVEICEEAASETFLPMDLNPRGTEPDKIQLSSTSYVQQVNAGNPTRKRKRSSTNSYSTPIKSARSINYTQRCVRHDVRKSLNENLVPIIEQEASHQTKGFAHLHEYSISGHCSTYKGEHISRKPASIHFRSQKYQNSKGRNVIDRSLVAVIRSNKLWRFKWFNENDNQSNQSNQSNRSQADYHRDMEYTPTIEGNARSIVSGQASRKFACLDSTIPSNLCDKYEKMHTDLRTKLLGNAMPNQLCSMPIHLGNFRLNETQIYNTSSNAGLDFNGDVTASAKKGTISTATTIVDDLLPNSVQTSWPWSSAVIDSLPTSSIDNYRLGSTEPSVRVQGNEKIMRNAGFIPRDSHLAGDQISDLSMLINLQTQQQHEPQRKLVQSGVNNKLNNKHLKNSSIGSNDKELSKKQKPLITNGSIAHQRTQIVLNLVQKCEGVFPGGSEICPPFSNLWKKLYGTATDSRTIMRAVKDTIDCGKLRRIHFSFRSKDGIVVTRSVLTLVSIAPDSPSVKVLRRAMIDSFPKLYRPPQVEDNASPRSLTLARHIFHRDLTSPTERQYRPLYLQKLEEHRASMANKRLTRSLESHGSIRKKVWQKKDRPNSQQFSSPLTGSGITRLSCLPRLSLFASQKQVTLGRKAFESTAVHVGKDFDIVFNNMNKLSNEVSPRDVLYIYQKLQPNMAVDPTCGRLRNLIVDMGLNEYLDRTTTLMAPIQEFQPFTGTFTTEFSTSCLKATFSREKLAESIQPVLENLMPQSITHMRCSQSNKQSEQDGSHFDQDYSNFSQEIKEVGIWEKNNETLVSSDLRLQRPRFINHTVPKVNRQCHNRPYSITSAETGSFTWLINDMRHNSDSNEFMDLQPRQQRGGAGYDCKYFQKKFSQYSSNSLTLRHYSKTPITFNAYQDIAYWPRVACTPPLVSSILSGFQSVSSSIQKFSVPSTASRSQVSVHQWDERHVLNRSTSPEHDQVRPDLFNHAMHTSSALGTRTSDSIPAKSANKDNYGSDIHGKKVIKRQHRRIHQKALLTDTIFSRRLLLTVSVLRILLGGIERLIDWNLVHSSGEFSQMTPSSLKKHWLLLKRNLCSDIHLDESRIQEALTIAYENNRMPYIDFHNIEKCKWKIVVDVVHQNLQDQEKQSKDVHDEVAEKRSLNTGIDQIQDTQGVRNELNDQNTLQMRRDHLLTILPSWEALYSKKPGGVAPNNSPKNLQACKARSWVRANILTPSENYCPEAALVKLQQLGEEEVANALKYFEERNLVREANDRRKYLRNLEMSESFYTNFKTPINTQVLDDAVAYKFHLDRCIVSISSRSEILGSESNEKSSQSFPIDPASPSGAFLAITNLAANDRVTIRPQSLPPGIGFDDPSPTTLQYDLEIRPSSRYIQGNPLHRLDRKWPLVAPSLIESDAAGKIPLWVDIHGNHLQQWWDRARACVLGLIATRSGISINGLKDAMNELMEHWEISAVVRWLVDVEAVKWLDSVDTEEIMPIESQLEKGLSTREWWWMALASESCYYRSED